MIAIKCTPLKDQKRVKIWQGCKIWHGHVVVQSCIGTWTLHCIVLYWDLDIALYRIVLGLGHCIV